MKFKAPRRGLAAIRTPLIAIRNKQITIADPGSANAPFTAVIGGLPEGRIALLAAAAALEITKVSGGLTTTFTGNIAFGSAPTADATLNGSEVDMIASTAITTAVAGVSALKRYDNITPVMIDNNDGSKEINLNGFIADAAISAEGVAEFDGYLQLAYVLLPY